MNGDFRGYSLVADGWSFYRKTDKLSDLIIEMVTMCQNRECSAVRIEDSDGNVRLLYNWSNG